LDHILDCIWCKCFIYYLTLKYNKINK
jgi:hypothetical protein